MNDPKKESEIHLLDQQEEFEFIETPTLLVQEAAILYEREQQMKTASTGCSESALALSRIGHLQVGEA
jgi:hypothetical protein